MIEKDKFIVEHEFTKSEIATYLKDFHETTMLAAKYYKQSFFEVFLNAMAYDNRIQFANSAYYQEMISIYQFQVLSKYLTAFYDNNRSKKKNNLNYLLENRLESISIPEKIFVAPSSKSDFSNQEIIELIRYAFNHNDKPDHALLKFLRVYENGKIDIYAELLVEDKDKGKLFKVRLNLGDFSNIILEFKSALNFNLLVIRNKINFTSSTDIDVILNNIYVRKFYPKGKTSEEQLKNLNDYFSEMLEQEKSEKQVMKKDLKTQQEELKKKQDEYEEFLMKNGLEFKDYSLTDFQKEKIKEELKNWPTEGNNVLFHLVNNVMPLSGLKLRNLIINFCLVDFFMKKPECSLDQIREEAAKIFTENQCPKNSSLYTYTKFWGIDNNFLYDVFDLENSLSTASAIYYGYLFDTLTTGKGDIGIMSGNEVSRTNLRNSFVHMRYGSGSNDSWELFDLKDKKNPSKKFRKIISSKDMEECSKRIYREKTKQESQKDDFMDMPIQFGYVYSKKEESMVATILCTKGSNCYFFPLLAINDLPTLKVIRKDQSLKDATEEEKGMFINELHNLSNRVNEKYKFLIDQIINMIQLTTSNIEPDVDIEKEKCKRKTL
ncbi:MAG TPA: hypothetical protein IAB56_03340 [Candidatus Scybalousia intestinigallinarum]|nr:hypothetical protein [Candidatus Scybalousia intestinigallinarum]